MIAVKATCVRTGSTCTEGVISGFLVLESKVQPLTSFRLNGDDVVPSVYIAKT